VLARKSEPFSNCGIFTLTGAHAFFAGVKPGRHGVLFRRWTRFSKVESNDCVCCPERWTVLEISSFSAADIEKVSDWKSILTK
jgi:hypothetical protein